MILFITKLKQHQISTYYLSILSGPLLACLCGTFICLVPVHNVLEQPSLWYEDQVFRYLAAIPILFQNLVRAEYWSRFTFERKWVSYLLLFCLATTIYVAIIIGYYILWTVYFEYFQPMPMSQHLCGSIMIVFITIAILFR